MCFAPQRRALFQHLNFQKWSDTGVFCTFWAKAHLEGKMYKTPQPRTTFGSWDVDVLHILTSKCASRHNGVHFFDIATSKSGPTLVCFVHFDFKMCFAPQRRALFRHRNFQKWSEVAVFCTFCLPNVPSHHNGVQHLNFQKWSEVAVFCTFCLPNVLRATTACTFSKLDLWASNSAPNPLCF